MSQFSNSQYCVSAVVSAYNSERFIANRLQNLVEQSLYPEGRLEIIVIDSSSPQNEGRHVMDFMRRFKHIVYVRTSQRETVYGAWNRGIRLSQGKYIINANTDDRFAADGLARMAAELDADSEAAAGYGDWLQTETENDRFDSVTSKVRFEYPEFNPLLLFHGQITSHAAMIRKTVFDKIGAYDGNFKVYGDREFMLRFASSGYRAKKIPAVVGLYLKNPKGLEFSEKDSGPAEFKALLDQYLYPRYFTRLCNRGAPLDAVDLARCYARAGELGKDFCKIDGQALSNLGTAGVLFAKALEVDRQNFVSLNNLGIVSCLTGNHEQGVQLFEKAANCVDSELGTVIAYNICLARQYGQLLPEYTWLTTGSTATINQKEITMKSPQKLHQEIQPLIENGWYDAAVPAYEKLLESYPNYAPAHHDLGVLHFNRGDKDTARLHYEKAVDFQPENFTYKKNLADFYYAALGQVEDALRLYVRALELKPEDAEVLMIAGHICVASNKYEDAKDFYNRVLEIEPWNADARQNMDTLSKFASTNLTSQSSEEMYLTAQDAASADRGREAIDKLKALLAGSPGHAPAHNDLGVLYYQAGDSEKAFHHYLQATRLDPANITFRKNLADFYCIGQQEYEKAMRIYVGILEMYPEDLETLIAVGYICENLNNPQDAVEFYNRVLQVEPWNLDARQKLDALQVRSMAM